MATSFADSSLAEVADKILEATRPYVARLSRLGANFGDRPAVAGATLQVPVVDVGEAASYDRSSNNYGDAQGSVGLVDVKLTSHPTVTIGITPEAYAQYGDAAVDAIEPAAIEQAAVRIGTAALKAWHNLLPGTSATTTAQLQLGHAANAVDKADFAAALSATLQGVAAGSGRSAFAGAEPANSALVLSAPAYAQALTLFDVAAYNHDGQNPVRDGWFNGGLLGFREVMCDPSIAATSIVGYVVPFDSFAFAGRPVVVRNPAKYDLWGYRRDDRSGLTLTFRTLVGALALPGQLLTLTPGS